MTVVRLWWTERNTGLEERVIPVEPASYTYRINCLGSEGNVITRTVRRRQFPMTPAYAFTDYRSQGQTLAAVIVDIATPPTGKQLFCDRPGWQTVGGLSLFKLYVALSRSSGQSTIRILRDFDENIFKTPQNSDLVVENKRLKLLNERTLKEWTDKQRYFGRRFNFIGSMKELKEWTDEYRPTRSKNEKPVKEWTNAARNSDTLEWSASSVQWKVERMDGPN